MKKLFAVTLILCSLNASSQNDTRGDIMELKSFFIGVTVGGYFANKNTANFYDGWYSAGVSRVLATQYYEDQIDLELLYSWTFSEFPTAMKYTAAPQIGLHVGYNASETFALIADVDIVNLKVQDFVTFSIDDPSNGSPGPTIETMPILGKEKRLSINVGFQNYLSQENNTIFYWSLAANATFTQFVNNTMKVRNLSPYYVGNPYWVGNGVPNPSNGTVQTGGGGTKPGGMGMGAVIGTGVKFKFNDQFLFDIGYNAIYTNVNLTGYLPDVKERGIQHSIFARIIWG